MAITHEKTCSECAVSFKTNRSHTLYCSDPCRQRAFKKRQGQPRKNEPDLELTWRDCQIIEAIADAIDKGVLHREMPTFTGRDLAHAINNRSYFPSRVNEREVNRLADRLGIFRNRRDYTRDFRALVERVPKLVQQTAAVKERYAQGITLVEPVVTPEMEERFKRGLPMLP